MNNIMKVRKLDINTYEVTITNEMFLKVELIVHLQSQEFYSFLPKHCTMNFPLRLARFSTYDIQHFKRMLFSAELYKDAFKILQNDYHCGPLAYYYCLLIMDNKELIYEDEW